LLAIAAEDPAATLSPKLRELLKEEMRLIDSGMGDLTSAISSGDWDAAAKTAEKIQHSFILKQALTEEEARQLHAKLPDGFIKMDQDFHKTSGKLAHAARAHDPELAGFYFHRMLDACVSCHATYAPNRFPGLAAPSSEPHHH
jgi:replication-associated recombination protein RarA